MIRVSVGVSVSCRVGGSDTISFKDVIGFLCLNVDNGRQTDRLNIATAGKTARTCFWRRLPAQQRNSDDIVSLWSVQLRTVKCTPVWTGDGERTSNNLKNGIVHLQHTHTHTHHTTRMQCQSSQQDISWISFVLQNYEGYSASKWRCVSGATLRMWTYRPAAIRSITNELYQSELRPTSTMQRLTGRYNDTTQPTDGAAAQRRVGWAEGAVAPGDAARRRRKTASPEIFYV